MKIDPNDVDMYSLAGTTKTAITAEVEKGSALVNITEKVGDVEFDFAPFFAENPEFIGKNFYFTRNDVLKGDNTFVKGFGWKEIDETEDGNRMFKRLGYESYKEIKPMTKGDIEAMEAREGEVRMYFLNDGRCVAYADATTGSNLKPGENPITFKLHGHHGRVAELKVVVNKGQ